MTIQTAVSDEEIQKCYLVMCQLRPHLAAERFVPRVRLQQEEGYALAYLEEDGQVRAVAGFRIMENLMSGRVLYVDDLVTDTEARSRGWGGELLSWLIDRARAKDCQTLELDSGVQRFDAHRFYLTHRMAISSHHFRLIL
ncbi:MAG: GNAT family N-acetyltransferase [Gemmatimonas sp.]|nr:GNAT family N-acetyltransferase [Gemmatimonas sp.]